MTSERKREKENSEVNEDIIENIRNKPVSLPTYKEGEALASVLKSVSGNTTVFPEKKERDSLCVKNGILDSVLDYIGKTPMIRLSRFAKKYGIECDLVAKCEFFSAGGSTKDRIAKRMVEESEKNGEIREGDLLVEATSGNTGIGLALVAAVKGYKTIFTLPNKMSNEKVNVMSALGAHIVRTPTSAKWYEPESHISMAYKIANSIKNGRVLDQYKNVGNVLAHYEDTAEEIIEQCNGKIDVIVIGAGTGGCITGIGSKIKSKIPNCRIIGVDPRGSILAVPDYLNDLERNESYLVEGIGYDFIPSTIDRSVVDEWVKTTDYESFTLARQLIRLEGLLCGGSSGAALYGALVACRKLDRSKRCVVVLPDSSRNYLNKFISDKWLDEHCPEFH